MAGTQLSSVVRAFEILEVLSEVDCVTPTELGQQLDVPVSTAHNYLSTLQTVGYIVETNGRYSISAEILVLGSRMRLNSDLYTTAKPVVNRLAKETGGQAAVGIEENERIFFLYIHNENDQYDIKNYPGMSLPLHATASGKLVLSELPEAQLESFLDGDLEAFTDLTYTDTDDLREELELVREQGYAHNEGEYEGGFETIAAPIRFEDELVGTICVTSLKNRMNDREYVETVVDLLLEAANVIEINLMDHPSLPEPEMEL